MLHYAFFVILLINAGTESYRLSYNDINDRYHLDEYSKSYNDVREKSYQKDDGIERDNSERKLEIQLSNLPANGELFEEDIVMDERLRQHVLGVNKRTSLKFPSIKWPNGVLIYDIDESFADCARELLKEAIEEYEKRTCITFKRRTNEKNYILYTSEKDVCSSNIGEVGGMQKIFIGRDCCVLGTVLHETMHALGFIHEHSRHDRDKYVQVKWDNIKEKERGNFNKYSVDTTTDNDVEYNVASVMHYRKNAFTSNGADTLYVYGDNSFAIGQRVKFSVGDVQGINRAYNCKEKPGAYDGLYKSYAVPAELRMKDMQRRKKEQAFLDLLKKEFDY